jgi:hypothetical protein
MNDQRFDALTKTLGIGFTRRRLLTTVAALATGQWKRTSDVAAEPTPTPADAVPPGNYPSPLTDVYGTCPAGGKGGDADLNTLKNRVDTADDDAWIPVTLDAVLALPEPEGTTRYLRNWPEEAKQDVDQYLGAPIRIESFVIGARRSGGETTNCNSGEYGQDDEVDYHLVFANTGETFDHAVVTEITPRVRVDHPSWTLETFGGLVAEETPVRISGWLLLDSRHSDHVGQVRGTRWEIHPVMRVEVLREGEWADLDNAVPAPQPPEASEPADQPTVVTTSTTDDCDPSYPTVCIPSPPPDLNCSDIRFRNFTVLPPDPHRLDQDHDGIGCVS